jgi:aldehyde:ferredoxin oxidoreductase
MNGFFNKVVRINVKTKTSCMEQIEDEIYLQFLGGKGLGTHLLLNNSKAGIDPLSKDNPLIIAVGPATNTKIWGSSRYGVFTKSPLTECYCESYAGGHVAESLSLTGYDAFIIQDSSDFPVWLEISDNDIKFHDATHLWGRDTYDTEDALGNEIGIRNAGILTIGPAGENQVRFAGIANNYWRSIGRGGAGCVLGSKKIKGIVFHGKTKKEIAKPALLDVFIKEMGIRDGKGPIANAYKKFGTPMLVASTNSAGAFPTKYWSAGTYEKWRNISAEALYDKCNVKPKACSKCFLACGRLTEIVDGRHKGLVIEGPEYETIYAFGGLCLIDDIREIAYLNDICDRLGMDTITGGNLAGFTIEASHKRSIGEKIEYGDTDAIASLLRRIAKQEGIGAILAKGIKHASKVWDLEDLAIHVKGMEPPGYDPRVLKGMGLAFATSDRGACHLRATIYKSELSGIVSPSEIKGKAELLIDYEDRHTLFDSLVLCRFYRDLYSWDNISTIIHAITGLQLNKPQLQTIASNITNLARIFNLREGLNKSDDSLPGRFFEQPLERSGKILPKSEFETMLSDYYKLKGWH